MLRLGIAFATFAALSGCRGDSTPTSLQGGEPNHTTQKADSDTSKSPDSWEYRSTEHGFSLSLPSSCWKPSKKKKHLAGFWCVDLASPMLVGVESADRQTADEFRQSVRDLKVRMDRIEDPLVKPIYQESEGPAGNIYVYGEICEKGDSKSRYIFSALCKVWIKEKGLTVSILFEGQGQFQGQFFKSREYAKFQNNAKAICLSVK